MISLEEVLHLHKNSIRDFGGSSGVRDINLLESSVTRPFQSFEGVELYPPAFEKAAAPLQSIVKQMLIILQLILLLPKFLLKKL